MGQAAVALDPGGTTGYAVWDGDKFIEHGQIGPGEHHDSLFRTLGVTYIAFDGSLSVVCESFEFRQNRQRDNIELMSREYIGVVKLFQQQHRIPLIMQTAALAKPFVTDEKLKVMGIWDQTKGEKHARDAYRHLIYYLVNRQKRYDLIECWKDL